jgi:predicted XRE-type DNA-binding protein
MNQPGLFRNYALDSSFFIDLFAHDGSHPRDRFAGLWRHFEDQVSRGEVIAPMEVRDELMNSLDGELDQWLVKHRSMFIEVARPQLEVIQKIVRAYPDFSRGKENMADPSVVALAAAEELTVLTSEHRQQHPSPRLPKIPNLCDGHGVPCLGINDYLRAEGVVLR